MLATVHSPSPTLRVAIVVDRARRVAEIRAQLAALAWMTNWRLAEARRAELNAQLRRLAG